MGPIDPKLILEITKELKIGKQLEHLNQIVSEIEKLTKTLEDAKDFSDRLRPVVLTIINASSHELTWDKPSFESGTTFAGPSLINIKPNDGAVWWVANRQGAFVTGVAGGGKWFLKGTDSCLIIGFSSPYTGSDKSFITVRKANKLANVGYGGLEDPEAKQATEENFYITVTKLNNINGAINFVYTIADV
ncbi:MAG: hypothetical protein JKY48_18080 [Flavobacteriales bacterium]|nr:hypothetical protein [Flavobacteriales bacterium]